MFFHEPDKGAKLVSIVEYSLEEMNVNSPLPNRLIFAVFMNFYEKNVHQTRYANRTDEERLMDIQCSMQNEKITELW